MSSMEPCNTFTHLLEHCLSVSVGRLEIDVGNVIKQVLLWREWLQKKKYSLAGLFYQLAGVITFQNEIFESITIKQFFMGYHCSGFIFHWVFALRWNQLRQRCFNYVVFLTIVLRYCFSIKEKKVTVTAAEKMMSLTQTFLCAHFSYKLLLFFCISWGLIVWQWATKKKHIQDSIWASDTAILRCPQNYNSIGLPTWLINPLVPDVH